MSAELVKHREQALATQPANDEVAVRNWMLALREYLADGDPSIGELRSATGRLEIVKTFARAIGAKDLTDEATITRAHVERRAGQVARDSGLRLPVEISTQYTVPRAHAGRWWVFSAANDEQFEDVIRECKERGEVSLPGIRSGLLDIEEPTSHDLIVRLIDGRYKIKVPGDTGYSQKIGKYGASLRDAKHRATRRKLSIAKDQERQREYDRYVERTKKHTSRDEIYENIRKAITSLDSMLGTLSPDARRVAEKAMHALYVVEDDLTELSRLL